MADEFVDFYEALGLSPDADRKVVRSRINEIYTEAQRNLDHRVFATRIKHQEMFEVILPRARYILLDDARRDEYDTLVRAFRGVAPIAPPVAPVVPAPTSTDLSAGTSGAAPTDMGTSASAFGRGDASSFRLAEEQTATPKGTKAPRVEGLPTSTLDPAQMEQRRDEMWLKWKSGLESAIARDEQEKAAPKPAPVKAAAPAATPPPRPPKPREPAKPIEFDFGADNAGKRGDSAPVPGAEEIVEEAKVRLSPEEIERVRTERKIEAVKEILMGVGMKGVLIGSMGTGFPLGGLLIYLMGHFYPRGAAVLPALPSPLAWMLGLLFVAGAAAGAAYFLSRNLRQKKAMELAMLSLEDILRELGRDY